MASCKDGVGDIIGTEETGWEIVASNLPKKSTINPKAQAIVLNWKEFYAFEKSFDQIYMSEFREDFVLVIEDLIEKQKALESGTYPKEFDIPQIKGRQKVLKTYILKIKGNLEYRQNPESSIKEMIAAFNAMREQFNVTVNYTLPEDLINDENN